MACEHAKRAEAPSRAAPQPVSLAAINPTWNCSTFVSLQALNMEIS